MLIVGIGTNQFVMQSHEAYKEAKPEMEVSSLCNRLNRKRK
nr:MAG TPA: hypothetical protein [Bacteriophage sp.]